MSGKKVGASAALSEFVIERQTREVRADNSDARNVGARHEVFRLR